MKLGIIGLPQSGKNTVFEALTRNFTTKNKNKISTINVIDNRLSKLRKIYNPKKTTHAQVGFFLPNRNDQNSEKLKKQSPLDQVKSCDALIIVIKNFKTSNIFKDFTSISQELILSDLAIVEKRLERITIEKKKGKKDNDKELLLLKTCLSTLEQEKPLRDIPELKKSKFLKGYSFLSSKPILILINNDDENEKIPENKIMTENPCMVIRGKLEQELAQMTEKEIAEFLNHFNISASTVNKVINASYSILGLVSFFTVGKDEVRAWTIKKNITALEAAKKIHSDIKKGFIRAEIVSYKDLMAAGSYSMAKKNGTVRLEGKKYIVQDGDIMNFRFNI